MRTQKAAGTKDMSVTAKKRESSLNFIFTKETFRLDKTNAMVFSGHQPWIEKFETNRYKALFHLGFEERPKEAGTSFAYLHLLAENYLKALTSHAELELVRDGINVQPDEDMEEILLAAVPYGIGSEYITKGWLTGMYQKLTQVFAYEISNYEGTVAMFLAEKSQNLTVPERIFFHLVEKKEEGEQPFAFLATYATRDETGSIRHMPLKYALTEYKNQREKLLELLSCLNRAAEKCAIIAGFVESGEMFHPLHLTPEEAYEFLKSIPVIEEAGILCRIPNWWKKHYASPSLSVSLGERNQPCLDLTR